MLYPIYNPRQRYIFSVTQVRKDDFKNVDLDFSAQKRIKENKSLQPKDKKITLSKENKCNSQ